MNREIDEDMAHAACLLSTVGVIHVRVSQLSVSVVRFVEVRSSSLYKVLALAHATCLLTTDVKSSMTALSLICLASRERACSPLLKHAYGRIQVGMLRVHTNNLPLIYTTS